MVSNWWASPKVLVATWSPVTVKVTSTLPSGSTRSSCSFSREQDKATSAAAAMTIHSLIVLYLPR